EVSVKNYQIEPVVAQIYICGSANPQLVLGIVRWRCGGAGGKYIAKPFSVQLLTTSPEKTQYSSSCSIAKIRVNWSHHLSKGCDQSDGLDLLTPHEKYAQQYGTQHTLV